MWFPSWLSKVFLQLFQEMGSIFLNLDVSKNIFVFISYVNDNLGGYRLCRLKLSHTTVDVILISFWSLILKIVYFSFIANNLFFSTCILLLFFFFPACILIEFFPYLRYRKTSLTLSSLDSRVFSKYPILTLIIIL